MRLNGYVDKWNSFLGIKIIKIILGSMEIFEQIIEIW